MKKIVVPGFAILLIASLIYFINSGKPEVDDYVFNPKAIIESRQQKDEAFKTDKKSPISDDEKINFKGLNYYPPSNQYIFKAKFTKFENPDTIRIKSTKENDDRFMLKYGKFEFIYQNQTFSLNIYTRIPPKRNVSFFVPFTDKTNNRESYEGGRYLDIDEIPGADTYTLDFNQAYNPYCAYNHKYSCPVVPIENNLPIEINAGEKVYKKY